LITSSALAVPTPSGELALGIDAAHVTRQRRRESVVLLWLEVPLERAVRAASLAPAVAANDSAQGELPEERTASHEASSAAPLEAGDGAALSTRFEPRLSVSLATAVVVAALKASGHKAAAARLDSMTGRSRWSAVLPELRLRGARGIDRSRRIAPTVTEPERFTEEGAVDTVLEARLSWRLGRLLFADQEIAVERLRSNREAARQRIAERALALLFAWERARFERARFTADPVRSARATLALLEAEIRLDVLTAGAFGRLLRGQPAKVAML
jgi:hypothetical protein